MIVIVGVWIVDNRESCLIKWDIFIHCREAIGGKHCFGFDAPNKFCG